MYGFRSRAESASVGTYKTSSNNVLMVSEVQNFYQTDDDTCRGSKIPSLTKTDMQQQQTLTKRADENQK